MTGLLSAEKVNPTVPSWFHRPSGAMHVFARRDLTVRGRTSDEDWERSKPTIDAAHERVFVGSSDHGIYALRAGDGSSIWRFETLGPVQSEALYVPETDRIYAGSSDGALYCLRAATGALVFRFDTGGDVARKPVLVGKTLYFVNAADFVFAIDSDTGVVRWQGHRTPALGMEISGHAGVAVDPASGTALTSYSDGHLVAYNLADGSEKWPPVDLSAEAEKSLGDTPKYLDADATPVIDDAPQGRVAYVSSFSAGVFAIDVATGSRVWSNTNVVGATDLLVWAEPAHAPHPHGPDRDGPNVPARKLLVVSSASFGLTALDPSSGRIVWRNKVPEGGITAPAAFAGGLLVGSSRYGLFLLAPANGRVIDGLDVSTGFAQSAATFGGRAYIMTNAGTLLGIGITPPLGVREPRQSVQLRSVASTIEPPLAPLAP